jgi:hypothetical protein
MKRLFVSMFIMSVSLALFAQQTDYNAEKSNPNEIRTLLGNNNAVGGYGAISIQYTQIDNRDAYLFGAKGGILMGHLVALGVSGKGFFNDSHFDSGTGQYICLAGGYGGFFFEPILMPRFPVHVSFPVLIGAGGVGVVNAHENNWDKKYKSQASDAFMVIEPGVEVELNITRFFRFCIGASYRYTTDIQIADPAYVVPSDIMRGISGGVTFKFGRF